MRFYSPKFPLLVSLILLATFGTCLAQDSLYSRFGVETADLEAYSRQVKENPHHELVDLSEYVPSIVTDVRYATTNNFMKMAMYDSAKVYLRKAAADSLRLIQRELNRLGLGLKVYDAYRPYSVTVKFYESYSDTTFVASPYTGSRHNRGCAIDVTLIDLRTGDELQMPTEYDDFAPAAHAYDRKASGKAVRNRRLLQKHMTAHGFDIYPAEWWHFDFRGWQKFDLLNIPFSELGK